MVMFAPASALGASLSALTVIVTVSVLTVVPSETCSSNVMSELVRPSGALNVGDEAFGSSSVTLGPPVWTQV